MKNYYLELVRQSTINYDGLIFYPISFSYICNNIGYDNFEKLIYPFQLSKDCFDFGDKSPDEIDLFDDLILRNNNLLSSITYILTLFCKLKDIQISYEEKFINLYSENLSSFKLDKNNFNDIADIVLQINGKEKLVIEKPPKNMSLRQKDVWEKIQEGRKKENKKNQVHIYDMINICEYAGNYHIPIDQINTWTLWKIINCYNVKVGQKEYDDSLKICIATGNSDNISGKNHWFKKLLLCDNAK